MLRREAPASALAMRLQVDEPVTAARLREAAVRLQVAARLLAVHARAVLTADRDDRALDPVPVAAAAVGDLAAQPQLAPAVTAPSATQRRLREARPRSHAVDASAATGLALAGELVRVDAAPEGRRHERARIARLERDLVDGHVRQV